MTHKINDCFGCLCTAQMPFRSAAQREKLNRIPACSFTSAAPNKTCVGTSGVPRWFRTGVRQEWPFGLQMLHAIRKVQQIACANPTRHRMVRNVLPAEPQPLRPWKQKWWQSTAGGCAGVFHTRPPCQLCSILNGRLILMPPPGAPQPSTSYKWDR